MVLGKNPPGKKAPEPKTNPTPNLILTLPLNPHGGGGGGGGGRRCFPDTDKNTCRKKKDKI